jgi:hypothetical protein
MNTISFLVFFFSINTLSFILLNYLSFRSNLAAVWQNMMKSNIVKILMFIFAIPALIVWFYNYGKQKWFSQKY